MCIWQVSHLEMKTPSALPFNPLTVPLPQEVYHTHCGLPKSNDVDDIADKHTDTTSH